MALQPLDRPAGSQHVLRYYGTIEVGVALATFPKANGEMTSGGGDKDPRGVRFLLADATDLVNTEKRFPAHVYDDQAPVAASPHVPVATGAVALIVNAGEDDISARTWAQNTFVTVKGLSSNLSSIDTEGCYIVRDTLTSGLGLNTGLPVLIVPIVVTGEGLAAVTMDVLVEVRWSAHR